MNKGIIDRFEGLMAIVEIDHAMIKIDRKDLPADAREGDVIKKLGDGWIIDRSDSAFRKKQIEELAKEIWED